MTNRGLERLCCRAPGLDSGSRVFLLEALDTSGSIDNFLLSRIERVANRADFNRQIALERRACGKGIAAATGHVHDLIIGMNA